MNDYKTELAMLGFVVLIVVFVIWAIGKCYTPRIVEINGHTYIETGSAIHRSLCHDPDCKCGGVR